MEFIRKMLPLLLETPGEFLSTVRHAVGGTALSLAYGIEIKPINDPFIELAEKTMNSISKASSSLWILFIDLIPILKYVPEFVPGAGLGGS